MLRNSLMLLMAFSFSSFVVAQPVTLQPGALSCRMIRDSGQYGARFEIQIKEGGREANGVSRDGSLGVALEIQSAEFFGTPVVTVQFTHADRKHVMDCADPAAYAYFLEPLTHPAISL